MGVIRYMGETDFAKGEWCGVELDEPLGKNDGAVAGTRYAHSTWFRPTSSFTCFHKGKCWTVVSSGAMVVHT